MALIYVTYSQHSPYWPSTGFPGVSYYQNLPPWASCSGLSSLVPGFIGDKESAKTDIVKGVLTDEARVYTARMSAEGLAYQVKWFAVGTDGYDPAYPLRTLDPDSTDTVLGHEVRRKTLSLVEVPNLKARSFYCRLNPDDIEAGIGEIALFAEILWSPVPAEIGVVFMFALAHRPLMAKTRSDVFVQRVVVQL